MSTTTLRSRATVLRTYNGDDATDANPNGLGGDDGVENFDGFAQAAADVADQLATVADVVAANADQVAADKAMVTADKAAAQAALAGAQQAQQLAQAAAGGQAGVGIAALNKSLLMDATVVAVRIYDTSRDSDGGGWRLRCGHTSWAQEAPSATRGARREFPPVAGLVLRQTALVLYDLLDLDTTGMPRVWMVFFGGGTGQFMAYRNTSFTAIDALNGRLYIGSSGAEASGNGGLTVIDFPADRSDHTYGHHSPTQWWALSAIVRRNQEQTPVAYDRTSIVHRSVSAVHARVHPGGPLDHMGLPIPTVAVATSSGASVIHPNGAVASITGVNVARALLHQDGRMWLSNAGGAEISVGRVPYVTASVAAWRDATYTHGAAGGALKLVGADAVQVLADRAAGGYYGLTLFGEQPANLGDGMVAHVTTAYATPWLVGAAALCLDGSSLTDRSPAGASVTGTATHALVAAGGDVYATTATSTLTVTVPAGGTVYGWQYTGGAWVWRPNTAAWGGAVTVSGTTLTIASGTVFTRTVYTTTTPTAGQLAQIERDDRPLLAGALTRLGGASNAVSSLSADDSRGLLVVGTGDGVSVYSGPRRVAYYDGTGLGSTIASDAITSVGAGAGYTLIGTAANAGVYNSGVSYQDEMAVRPATGGPPLRFGIVTLDAAATTFGRVDVPEGELWVIQAVVSGAQYGSTPGERMALEIMAEVWRPVGGAVTIDGTPGRILLPKTTDTLDATLIAPATDQIAVRVIGKAGVRMVWGVTWTITKIRSI